jgi:hypothetical protein
MARDVTDKRRVHHGEEESFETKWFPKEETSVGKSVQDPCSCRRRGPEPLH